MLTLSHARVAVALAILMVAFVSLYPYLDSAGYCDRGGCPDLAQLSHAHPADPPAPGAVAVLAASGAAAAALASAARRWGTEHRRPAEPCLAPEPPPPRPFL